VEISFEVQFKAGRWYIYDKRNSFGKTHSR